jgi:hypothetical protein
MFLSTPSKIDLPQKITVLIVQTEGHGGYDLTEHVEKCLGFRNSNE